MNNERAKCDSGLSGWQCRLRDNYEDLEEWTYWSDLYGLCERLGFKTVGEAWEANPMIQGSVDPSDFRVVTDAELEQVEA